MHTSLYGLQLFWIVPFGNLFDWFLFGGDEDVGLALHVVGDVVGGGVGGDLACWPRGVV